MNNAKPSEHREAPAGGGIAVGLGATGNRVRFLGAARPITAPPGRRGQAGRLALALALAGLAAPAQSPLDLASGLAQPSHTGSGGSFAPAFSADGRFLVFLSYAPNLVTNDDRGPWVDVFVRDLAAQRTTLVSVGLSGRGGANADALNPSIASNGQWVGFASAADNLVAGDTNRVSDVFLRDLAAGATALISVDRDGQAPPAPYPGSLNPLVSSDARWVFFESTAGNLVEAADGYNTLDVFARDRQQGVTHLVSARPDGSGGVNAGDRVELASITPDGRFAALLSASPGLAPEVAVSGGEVYVRDLQARTTAWASSNVAALLGVAPGAYRARYPVLSDDGRWVLFKVSALNATAVVRHDLASGVSELVATDSRADSWPALSAEGRWMAFEEGASLVLRDALAATSTVINTNGVPARAPVMTPDGRRVAYLAYVPDQGARDRWRAMVWDVATQAGVVASVTVDGREDDLPAHVVPALSADGQKLAMETDSGNWFLTPAAGALADWTPTRQREGEPWVEGDDNGAPDVFVRDLGASLTTLVSAAEPSRPARTRFGLTLLDPDCLSADGRWLAFARLVPKVISSNTAPAASDTRFLRYAPNLIVRDLRHGTNLVVDAHTNFVQRMGLTADGRHLWYQEYAAATLACRDLDSMNRVGPSPNLGFGRRITGAVWTRDGATAAVELRDANYPYSTNIYLLRDSLSNLVLISRASASDGPGNGHSCAPLLSPDDQWLLFQSLATDIAPGSPVSSANELFACALWTNSPNTADYTNRMISVLDGRPLGCQGRAAISASARWVAFASLANPSNDPPQGIYVHDLATHATSFVLSNAIAPAISADGRWVAAQSLAAAYTNQILLCDRDSGTTTLVSASRLGGGGNGPSSKPLITADGRYVIYLSQASDLVADDTNGLRDIFLYDMVNTTTLVATRPLAGGATSSGVCGVPILGADGQTVLFTSFADDLSEGDYNQARDVFVLRLGGTEDTDGDGLDDAWEMAYFNTLSRDGTGDFDGDGATDAHEFRAGTDPTDQHAVLRAIPLLSLANGELRLLWPAAPGRAYRVEYKDGLDAAPWADLGAPIHLDGATGWCVDTNAPACPQRFYRVVVQPGPQG